MLRSAAVLMRPTEASSISPRSPAPCHCHPLLLRRYEAYNEKHGAKLATAGEVEAEMDEW